MGTFEVCTLCYQGLYERSVNFGWWWWGWWWGCTACHWLTRRDGEAPRKFFFNFLPLFFSRFFSYELWTEKAMSWNGGATLRIASVHTTFVQHNICDHCRSGVMLPPPHGVGVARPHNTFFSFLFSKIGIWPIVGIHLISGLRKNRLSLC